MCFADTRESHEYNESHVITAKFAPRVSHYQMFSGKESKEFVLMHAQCLFYVQNDIGAFIVPHDAELETKEHVVVYDSNTSSLKDKSGSLKISCLQTTMIQSF